MLNTKGRAQQGHAADWNTSLSETGSEAIPSPLSNDSKDWQTLQNRLYGGQHYFGTVRHTIEHMLHVWYWKLIRIRPV